MLNVAIIGLGRWGRRLVDSVQENGAPKSDKIHFRRAVVHTLANHREYAASQKLSLGDTLEDALNDRSIDAVVLATPHLVHPEQIVAAAKAGKHVFVEKPLALTFSEAAAAISAANEAKVVVAVGFNRRYLPVAERLKKLLAEGAFGTLLHIDGNFSNDSGLNYKAGMWRAAESGPKSAMTAMGIHTLDFFIHLFGPIESVRTTSTRIASPVDVDDVVFVNIKFKNGATGSLSTMLSTPRHWRVQIFGTKLSAHMRDEHLLDLNMTGQPLEEIALEAVDTVRLELESFAAAVSGESEFRVPTEDALHGVAAFEAILKSAAQDGALVSVKNS
jgi:predicted dehydrogenase